MLKITNKNSAKQKKKPIKTKLNKRIKKRTHLKRHVLTQEHTDHGLTNLPMRHRIHSHDELLHWIDTVYDHYN